MAYTYKGRRVETPPALTADWADVQPIFEVLPGWQASTSSITTREDLPLNAQKYLERLEVLCDCPISLVSVGPERDKTLFIRKFMES